MRITILGRPSRGNLLLTILIVVVPFIHKMNKSKTANFYYNSNVDNLLGINSTTTL